MRWNHHSSLCTFHGAAVKAHAVTWSFDSMARCKIQGEQENINPTNDVRNRHPLLLKAHSTDCTPQKKTLKLPTLEGDRPLPRYSPFYDDKPDKSGYYHSPMKDELYMQRVEPFDTFNNNILLIA